MQAWSPSFPSCHDLLLSLFLPCSLFPSHFNFSHPPSQHCFFLLHCLLLFPPKPPLFPSCWEGEANRMGRMKKREAGCRQQQAHRRGDGGQLWMKEDASQPKGRLMVVEEVVHIMGGQGRSWWAKTCVWSWHVSKEGNPKKLGGCSALLFLWTRHVQAVAASSCTDHRCNKQMGPKRQT